MSEQNVPVQSLIDHIKKAEGGIRNERGCESGADDTGEM